MNMNNNMSLSSSSSSSSSSKKRFNNNNMYGDLIGFITVLSMMPWYIHLVVHVQQQQQLEQQQQLLNDNVIVRGDSLTATTTHFFYPYLVIVTLAMCVTVLQGVSWLYNNIPASILAFAVAVFNSTAMILYQWPHPDQGLLISTFVWHVLLASINMGYTLQIKILVIVSAATSALFQSYVSPLFTVQENVTTVCVTTAAVIMLHCVISWWMAEVDGGGSVDSTKADKLRSRQRKLLRSRLATVVMLGILVYHLRSAIRVIMIQPELMLEVGFAMMRVCIYGAIGLMAAGDFRRELDAKEVLEDIVEERTTQIQKQSEQIIKQNDELRMAGLAIQASETAMAITGAERRIIWSNPALQRLTGHTDHGSLLHIPLEEALHPPESDIELLQNCFRESSSAEQELVINGKIILVQVSPSNDTTITAATASDVSPNGNDMNKTNFVVVLKDITESRRLEQAIASARDEAMMSRLNEAMETLTHELRTPLQGIMGMTSMMLDSYPDDTLPADIKDPLTIVMVSSRLLLTLINNLLDVRKCEAGMLDDFEEIPIVLKSPITNAIDFCRPLATISGVNLELDFEESPVYGESESVMVLSDSLRIQQVGINLVSNAIKYSPTGSTVQVRCNVMSLTEAESQIEDALAAGEYQPAFDSTEDQTIDKDNIRVIVVSVMDQGQGIDECKKSSMFKKFAQLGESMQRKGNATVGQPSGTGLGLNLCDKFLHRMKGNIWVNNNTSRTSSSNESSSSHSNGACFSFYLPLHDNTTAEAIVDNADTLSKSNSEAIIARADHGSSQPQSTVVFPNWMGVLAPHCNDLSQLRILSVDDTLINLKVLERMLKRVGVHTVVSALSGEKALEILEQSDGKFDLVITDIQMPDGMSGTDLSGSIRSMDHTVVVVGLTAEVSMDLDRRCAASGMSYVLHKPMTNDKLHDFLHALITPPTT